VNRRKEEKAAKQRAQVINGIWSSEGPAYPDLAMVFARGD
jgi:hypothetical protein